MTEFTKKQLALHLLREAGPRGVTGTELLGAGCGSRYGARVQDLREDGHVIEADPVRAGLFNYTLTFDIERDVSTPASSVPSHSPEIRVDGEGTGMASAACDVSLGADPAAASNAGERSADDGPGDPLSPGPEDALPAAPPALFDPPPSRVAAAALGAHGFRR